MYTPEEIEALTTSELQEIIYFGNDQMHIPYSEIASFFTNDETQGVILKDGRTLVAESPEAYERLVTKRMRYELVLATLSGVEHDVNSRASFMDEVATTISDQLKLLSTNYVANSEAMSSTINNIKNTSDAALNFLDEEIGSVSKMYKTKLDKFDKFNTETYEVKMQKVDKIIDAFKDLLK